MKRKPPVEISKAEMIFLGTLIERDRRHFIACKVTEANSGSVKAVCKVFGCSPNTVSKAVCELTHHIVPPNGRQRMPGGGAKRKTGKHPEWVAAFGDVVSRHMAGLPQDDGVIWFDVKAPQSRLELLGLGCDVSEYIVRQMIRQAGLKRRSFSKNLPLDEAQDRDSQFVKIGTAKAACIEAGIPIISIDTKKKMMTGNFRHDGQVYCSSAPKALDHDFGSFSSGMIVPHGIYDITRNTGYLTIGTSLDTSEFVCSNIERFWNGLLRQLYPDARLLVVLCYGGGSNSSIHNIVNQNLMDIADRTRMKILVMHYPPYRSKFNPIKHRLFSQITHSWNRSPLYSAVNACRRAANTVTKDGLKVFAEIIDKVFLTKRKVFAAFKARAGKQILFDNDLQKWNYLISPSVSSHVIF